MALPHRGQRLVTVIANVASSVLNRRRTRTASRPSRVSRPPQRLRGQSWAAGRDFVKRLRARPPRRGVVGR
jgi:hypothetical protein